MSMKSLSVDDSIRTEGTASQIFVYGSQFLFYNKKRETFCNCFLDNYSLFYKMIKLISKSKFGDSIPCIQMQWISCENFKWFRLV